VSTEGVVVIVDDDGNLLLFNKTIGTTMAATSTPNPTMLARMIRSNLGDLARLFECKLPIKSTVINVRYEPRSSRR